MSLLSSIKSVASKVITAIKPTEAKISNTVNTLKAAVTGQGVVANTGNKTVNKVLSSAASNPFTTAAVVATVASPKTAVSAIKEGTSSLSPKTKVIAAVTAPVIIGAVVSNPSLIADTTQLPKEASQFGSDIGKLSKEPTIDNAVNLVKENPIITGAIALGSAAVVGTGIIGIASNIANTQAVRENTEVKELKNNVIIEDKSSSFPRLKDTNDIILTSPSMEKTIPVSSGNSLIPLTPATQVIGKSVGTKSHSKKVSSKKNLSNINNRLSVNIYNQSKSLYMRGSHRC